MRINKIFILWKLHDQMKPKAVKHFPNQRASNKNFFLFLLKLFAAREMNCSHTHTHKRRKESETFSLALSKNRNRFLYHKTFIFGWKTECVGVNCVGDAYVFKTAHWNDFDEIVTTCVMLRWIKTRVEMCNEMQTFKTIFTLRNPTDTAYNWAGAWKTTNRNAWFPVPHKATGFPLKIHLETTANINNDFSGRW